MTADPTGPIALAFDELACGPDFLQIAGQLREHASTGLLDQYDTAAAHNHANIDALWVRLGALAALAAWVTGRASTCLHAPHPNRPQPLHAAAWKPGLIVCGHCTHLLALPRRSAADRTCDGCGHVTTGGDDPIQTVLLAIGGLTYTVGTCRRCPFETPRRTEESP